MATEKRLIYAEDLQQAIRDDLEIRGVQYALAFKHIREAKTVDAVEVVRCKDCKHWLHMEDSFGDCTNGRFHLGGFADPTMNADDFCSCGERRTDA